jgi:Tfp pilus assembly protein PilN
MNPFSTRDPSATGRFLPDEYIAERHDARANLLTISLFAITLAAVLTAFFVTNRHWSVLRDQEATINVEYQSEAVKIEQLKHLERQRSAILVKAEITAELVEKLPRWAVLGELTLRMPASVRLSSCEIKSERGVAPDPVADRAMTNLVAAAEQQAGEKTIVRPRIPVPVFTYRMTLEGKAATNNDVADYLASLKASPALTGVELTFIRDAGALGEPMRQFQITAVLSSSGDTEALAASLRQLMHELGQAPPPRKGLLGWLTGGPPAGRTASGGEDAKEGPQ